MALLRLRAFDEAISSFKKALHLQSTDAHILHNNIGVALQNRGDFKKAISHFKRAIRLNPGYALTYTNLGSLFDRLGEYEKAIQFLSEAVRLSPGSFQAQKKLISFL